jgi:heme-degrading monooxygenase HmoA
MTIMLTFDLNLVSAEVYDHRMRLLEPAGTGMPSGRLYHVAYGPPDRLKIVDVWESPQQFQQFCVRLVPTLERFGVVLNEPDVKDVYNIIKPRTGVHGPARLLVRFDPPGMNAGQYNEIVKHLGEAGYGAPAGRLYHVCYREGEDVRMMSVWDSDRALRAFFDRLVPITADLGMNQVPRTDLAVEKVHRVIDGSSTP